MSFEAMVVDEGAHQRVIESRLEDFIVTDLIVVIMKIFFFRFLYDWM
jgi:hypothetical protein